MDILDRLLKKRGIENYDELNPIEKETYKKMVESLEAKRLTFEDLKDHVVRMKNAVASQLADTPETERERNIHLKARLKNYATFEEILSSPERARKAIEKYLKEDMTPFDDEVDNG